MDTDKAASMASSENTVIEPVEVQRQNINSSNPRGNSNIQTGVNVAAAEAEFQELSRQLTGLSKTTSRQSRRMSRTNSRTGGDPEKSAQNDEETEQFDLEDHLRGNESADREAGIRPKRIGKCHFCLVGPEKDRVKC
jgi:ATP-binding cassette, subfamily G (WHITE), member 2, SNQ2